jgi:hypothetical protein
MRDKLDKVHMIRRFVLTQITDLQAGQLNKIPNGFNNNIIWNMAHMVAAMQVLCYKRANQPITMDDRIIFPYLTGTKPQRELAGSEIDEIKRALIESVSRLAIDLETNDFSKYTPSPNIFSQYNMSLNSIDDALDFVLYHDGYHIGNIVALKRFVI